jgi:autotransporter translocation and assembly factor TamB
LSSRAIDLIEPIHNTKHESSKRNFTPSLKCPVNIKFNIKQGLKITGYGIDSLWNGGATIAGNITALQYNAKMILKNGKIAVSDNNFKLKNGEILFDSTGLKVNVSAEKKLENKIVGARFFQNEKGTKVKFFSSPHMSKKDILSYMLFDKSSADISITEGLTLFSVMNQISGGSDVNIITKLKTTLHFDSIALRRNSNSRNEEYNAVSIGKKIGKLRISVDQGAAKDTTNVVIETNIAKNTKISVDLSGKESIGAGISLSKRY